MLRINQDKLNSALDHIKVNSNIEDISSVGATDRVKGGTNDEPFLGIDQSTDSAAVGVTEMGDMSRRQLSQVSKGTSKARAKLSLLTMMKSTGDPIERDYKKQLHYFSKASLFQLNHGQTVMTKKKNFKHLASSYLERSTSLQSNRGGDFTSSVSSLLKRVRLEDKYPRLLQELSDPNAPVPAYVRFQRQKSCVLREDLRQIKE